jgi:Transposase
MRIIGLDIHRAFAEAVAWKDGKLSRLGRVIMRREPLEEFAKQLSNSDIVVIEATGNAASVAAVIGPHVSRVVIANPKQVRLIAHAKIKTDKIDAGVLAQLYASGFLPEVWIADEPTQALRRQVTRRNQIVRQRSRLKNIIQSILHAHLIPSCPHQNLCGPKSGFVTTGLAAVLGSRVFRTLRFPPTRFRAQSRRITPIRPAFCRPTWTRRLPGFSAKSDSSSMKRSMNGGNCRVRLWQVIHRHCGAAGMRSWKYSASC